MRAEGLFARDLVAETGGRGERPDDRVRVARLLARQAGGRAVRPGPGRRDRWTREARRGERACKTPVKTAQAQRKIIYKKKKRQERGSNPSPFL